MMKIKLGLLFFLTPLCLQAKEAKTDDPYLGTKTFYVPQQDPASYEKAPEGCRPIFFSLLTRHGSRSLSSGKEYFHLLKIFTGAREQSSLSEFGERVYTWLKETDTSEFGLLTKQGENEMFSMGERVFHSYPHLFSNATAILVSTHVKRTHQSRDVFIQGLNHLSHSPTQFESVEGVQCEDFELRFFDNCRRYQSLFAGESKNRIDAIFSEIFARDFNKSHVILALERLFTKTFLEKFPYEKKLKLLRELYSMCQRDYDKDPSSGEDRFCSTLTLHLRRTFEFAKDDVQSFYKLGPVHQTEDPLSSGINYKMACIPLNSILKDMEDAVHGCNTVQSHLRFAHLETVLPLAVLMGLFDTETDLGIEPSPQWRSRNIGGMGSNIQWTAYKCVDNGLETFKIKMLYSEKEQHFPIASCQDSFFCDWENVKDYYKKRYEDLGLGSCSMAEWIELCDDRDDLEKVKCLERMRLLN
jgi:hypothetical protein